MKDDPVFHNNRIRFRKDLTDIINKCGIDNDCDVPDYRLADWLCEILSLFYERKDSLEAVAIGEVIAVLQEKAVAEKKDL